MSPEVSEPYKICFAYRDTKGWIMNFNRLSPSLLPWLQLDGFLGTKCSAGATKFTYKNINLRLCRAGRIVWRIG